MDFGPFLSIFHAILLQTLPLKDILHSYCFVCCQLKNAWHKKAKKRISTFLINFYTIVAINFVRFPLETGTYGSYMLFGILKTRNFDIVRRQIFEE